MKCSFSLGKTWKSSSWKHQSNCWQDTSTVVSGGTCTWLTYDISHDSQMTFHDSHMTFTWHCSTNHLISTSHTLFSWLLLGLSYCRHMSKVRTSVAHMISTSRLILDDDPAHAHSVLTEELWREFTEFRNVSMFCFQSWYRIGNGNMTWCISDFILPCHRRQSGLKLWRLYTSRGSKTTDSEQRWRVSPTIAEDKSSLVPRHLPPR